MTKILWFAIVIIGVLAVLLPLSGQLSVASATASADTGKWTVTGSLNTPRFYHTATRLKNGKVLIVGGETYSNSSSIILSSAELYDPASGKWNLTGSMNIARYNHTATLLSNSEVLVVGGQDSNGNPLASAELYNPNTGRWSLTGSLNHARYSHIAKRLGNGQVLVAGGEDEGNFALASAELYNPGTGKWSLTGSMNTARQAPTATLLNNGQVLVTGGSGNTGNVLASAELYDPNAGKWNVTGSMNQIRFGHTATRLKNGQVLVAGGEYWSNMDYGIAVASAELYNPATGKWSFTGSMNSQHAHHTATLLDNGQVLVAGNVAQAELYDPSTGKWNLTGSMNNTRELDTATRLDNGQVLVIGGQGNSANPIGPAELYLLGSGSAGTLSCNSWCVVTSPNASTANNFLRGIAAVSPNNAWAVGYDMNQYNQALIEHYDGTTWKVFPSPSPGNADNRLFGVAALSANNVWAVGTYDIAYHPAQTLVEHFNGTGWTVINSPSPNSFDVDLVSVSANSANDIWAVGYYATSNTTTSTLIEHYDGKSWKIVPSLSPGSAYNYLKGVTAISANNIWVVGNYSNTGTPYDTTPQTLIEHFDGTSWKTVSSPSPGSGLNVLTGISAVSASNIWAVGIEAASNNPGTTLVEHYNGTSWAVVPSPNSILAGSYSDLSAVMAISANNIWAVGNVGILSSGAGAPVEGPFNGTTQEPTLIEHYNGTNWQIVSSPSPGANANVLEAVARVPGTSQVWTAGYEFMTYGPNEAAQTLIEFHS